ncbi:MAG: hypothetical protein AAGE84_20805 [Cyanobacteria bacterium P01_G01_bin.39]
MRNEEQRLIVLRVGNVTNKQKPIVKSACLDSGGQHPGVSPGLRPQNLFQDLGRPSPHVALSTHVCLKLLTD